MTADEMLQAEARPEAEFERLQKIRDVAPELDYAAVFVPQSQSRNAGEKNPSLNWRVTLNMKGPGKGREILTCDYMQGIGHAPKYRASRYNSTDQAIYFRDVAEKGKYTKGETPWEKPSYQWHITPLPAPALADVLHSLLLDADALDFGGFEEWARDLGYDPDSREGERVYRACLETGLKLRAALGDEKMAKLREALRDMQLDRSRGEPCET